MAKLTKFTLSPSGDLVYRKTGRLAPDNYIFRKNTVYRVGEDGVRRRVGTLSRKITKTEAAKISRAEKNREKRKARELTKPSKPSKSKPRRPAQPSQRVQRFGDDWEEVRNTEFPEPDQIIKEEFAQRVRDCALSVAPQWLQRRIQALSTDALWEAYKQDAYVFEMYFRYHDPQSPPTRSDASMWLYQFVTRIEQYMGVSS